MGTVVEGGRREMPGKVVVGGLGVFRVLVTVAILVL